MEAFEKDETRWFLVDGDDAVARLQTDRERGLTSEEVTERLRTNGPNELESEPPPSRWQIALHQLADPMNLMLVAVSVVSLLLSETSTGVLVAILMLLNVVLGAHQELKAREAVDALAQLQVPTTRVCHQRLEAETPTADAAQVSPPAPVGARSA